MLALGSPQLHVGTSQSPPERSPRLGAARVAGVAVRTLEAQHEQKQSERCSRRCARAAGRAAHLRFGLRLRFFLLALVAGWGNDGAVGCARQLKTAGARAGRSWRAATSKCKERNNDRRRKERLWPQEVGTLGLSCRLQNFFSGRRPAGPQPYLRTPADAHAYHLKPCSMRIEALVAHVAPRATGATHPTS